MITNNHNRKECCRLNAQRRSCWASLHTRLVCVPGTQVAFDSHFLAHGIVTISRQGDRASPSARIVTERSQLVKCATYRSRAIHTPVIYPRGMDGVHLVRGRDRAPLILDICSNKDYNSNMMILSICFWGESIWQAGTTPSINT